MKRLALLSAAICMWACSAAKQPPVKAEAAAPDSAGSGTDKAIESALADLESAVARHDRKGVIVLLDPDYDAKEFKRVYHSDATVFLNAFFCGKVLQVDQLYCQDFADITGMKRISVDKGDLWAAVVYHVETPVRVISARLKVTLEKGKVLGLIGSNGYTQIE